MTLDIPQHISRRIEETLATVGADSFPMEVEAKGHGAIVLMGTIGLVCGLRPDGTMLEFDEDFGRPLSRLKKEDEIMALAAGVERYEWLAELLPVRPPKAIDCPLCLGNGKLGPKNYILCSNCQCLGWVLP